MVPLLRGNGDRREPFVLLQPSGLTAYLLEPQPLR
jgi:hypothetical protein